MKAEAVAELLTQVAGGTVTPQAALERLRHFPVETLEYARVDHLRPLTQGHAEVVLSAREFALLHALLDRPGAVLSRQQLEDKLYGWDREVESNAVEVHIHALRRKLGAEFIRNVRGVGYMVATKP